MRITSVTAPLLGGCMLAFGSVATAQTTACYTYDETGRLVEAEYSDGSELLYDLDRNDNRNGTTQSPSGAATCATPTASTGLIAGGDLGAGAGAPPPPPPPPPPGNTPPVANADASGVMVNQSVFVMVLVNDTDVDGDTLTITSVTTPSMGNAGIITGNKIQYTAGASEGLATFSYTISDGNGGTATASVSVNVFSGF